MGKSIVWADHRHQRLWCAARMTFPLPAYPDGQPYRRNFQDELDSAWRDEDVLASSNETHPT